MQAESIETIIGEFKQDWVSSNPLVKGNTWWMEIFVPHGVCFESSEAKHVVSSNKESSRVLLQITWDNVLKYGKFAVHNTKQSGAYDETNMQSHLYMVRKEIAKQLELLCTGECVWEMVGSDSQVSDIDINIFDDQVDEKLALIHSTLHNWIDENAMEELFDMNVYVSAFCRKEKTVTTRSQVDNAFLQRRPALNSQNYVFVQPPTDVPEYQDIQRTWALVHLYRECEDAPFYEYVHNAIASKGWRSMWRKAGSLHKCLQDARRQNTTTFSDHVRTAQHLWKQIASFQRNTKMISTKPSSITSNVKCLSSIVGTLPASMQTTMIHYMNMVSTIQYYSRETYYTRGAYFHVVMSLSNKVRVKIHPSEYIDSVIDNLAFIAELCHKKSDCPIQYTSIFAKISKYIYRICDAFYNIYVRDDKTIVVRTQSQILNDYRKMFDLDMDVMIEHMLNLHTSLGIDYALHKNNHYTAENLIELFMRIFDFVMTRIPGNAKEVMVPVSPKCADLMVCPRRMM